MYARDNDLTAPFNVISFAVNDPTGTVAINATTGIITLARALSFPVTPSFSFTVTASDHGTPPLTSAALTITGTVIEVNLHSPQWVGAPYSNTYAVMCVSLTRQVCRERTCGHGGGHSGRL